MSKLVEEVALEYCKELDIDCFSSVDSSILYEIYNRAKRRKGFKRLKKEFPKSIINRIRNCMRTSYYFSKVVVPVRIGRISLYRIKSKGAKVNHV